MIEAVLTFGVISAVFELIVLLKLCSARVLNNKAFGIFVHITVFLINITVHYGTITGTMTAIVAALASFATLPIARLIVFHFKGAQA